MEVLSWGGYMEHHFLSIFLYKICQKLTFFRVVPLFKKKELFQLSIRKYNLKITSLKRFHHKHVKISTVGLLILKNKSNFKNMFNTL